MRLLSHRLATALAVSAAALAVAPVSVAHAAPGDNGDVKIHNATTPVDDQRDEPKVCKFYLDAFNFDTIQQVSWTIDEQPPTGRAQAASGTITLSNGTGHTGDMVLPDGHYKLEWTFAGEKGKAKQKVFMVECPSGRPTTPPSQKPGGGVETGGGGSVHGVNTAEVAGGSALLAIAAGLGARALRRRTGRRAAS